MKYAFLAIALLLTNVLVQDSSYAASYRESNGIYEIILTHDECNAAAIVASLATTSAPNPVTVAIGACIGTIAAIDEIGGNKGVAVVGTVVPAGVSIVTPRDKSAFVRAVQAGREIYDVARSAKRLVQHWSDSLSGEEKQVRQSIEQMFGRRRRPEPVDPGYGAIDFVGTEDQADEFIIVLVTGKTVKLVSHRGFLTIGDVGATANANDTESSYPDHRTEFEFQSNADDGSVSIFSFKNKHWGSVQGTVNGRPGEFEIDFTKDRTGPWERFRLSWTDHGTFKIQSNRVDPPVFDRLWIKVR